MDRKIDEAKGSSQQTQDKHVEEDPQQVEPRLLSCLPLCDTQGEALLLEEQLRSSREKHSRAHAQHSCKECVKQKGENIPEIVYKMVTCGIYIL